jgi:hypothetical protein
MYLLSENAIEQYRQGAKNGADIPVKMLRVKLNCLCQAGNKEEMSDGIQYSFGKCVIEVKDNTITKVYWDNKRNHTVAQWEGDRLRRIFKRNNLDETGNNWLQEKKPATILVVNGKMKHKV